ncbi:acyl-CoA/acyl-ACP dehydrogenase [Methylobacterium sp. C25]|uniref:acyl-CoA dehydrogenase family protein n=1 Tax=Methylobacterium sp. C25 TaxID=2721622 RepID=UPI001F2EB883|nr:acyl-CoA dehydrogenase family protein [Methylobacterium sp. C25]MCE4222587.1 acyl-CoA/acyl-ACP dehydrogenase [Methylobacterium sp. C25]
MPSALALRPAETPDASEAGRWSDEAVLAATTAIADGPLAAAAGAIDHGTYPLDILGQLGEAGALGVHLDRHGGRVGLSIAAMQAVSRACGATGFLMWCHDVCGLYMEQSGNPALTGTLLDDHAAGRSFGGTALSNPMKAFAGIEPILLRAQRVAGGYRVSGMLPWVSHIDPGQYCGAIAGVDANGGIGHEIMFLLRCDRAELRRCPEFSGMEGTSTWGLKLDDYFVGQGDIIADPARPLIGRIRGAFILLQCGMGLGVAEGSLDSMLAVEETLGHVNQFLDDRPAEIAAELAELRARVMRLAETPYESATDYLIDVLDARAQTSELALRAAQSALLHQGARGYMMSAAPQRRAREAHFVAIVTPAIKHLRWEMARLSREVLPAASAQGAVA